MLSTPAGEVAIEPIIAKESDSVGDVLKVLRPNVPVFVPSGDLVIVVDRSALKTAPKDGKVINIGCRVKPASSTAPLYEIARLMYERNLRDFPVKDHRLLGITYRIILGALKATKEMARREARTVMSPVPVIRESRLKNAENIASKNQLTLIPVVNETGRLIGIWKRGKFSKKALMVREGTRVKLVIDKVLQDAVVVVNKQRKPVGVIDVDELIELAASYRELTSPIFYAGLENLAEIEREQFKGEVRRAMSKIAKMVPISYASVHLRKKGVWNVKIKLSTPWGTFMSARESNEAIKALFEALQTLTTDVKREKERVVKRKQLTSI